MNTIFFDFGKVIGFFDHQRAIAQLLPFTTLTGQDLERILYGDELEFAYERGEITTDEYVTQAIDLCQLRCSQAQFIAAFTDIFWRNEEICSLIPKLKPHFRIALASNTNAAHFDRYREQFADVLKHFDALCPSHWAGHRKPMPGYFEYCQQYAGAEPGECLFIDDLPENITAAHQHGWQSWLYVPGNGVADKLWGLTCQDEQDYQDQNI